MRPSSKASLEAAASSTPSEGSHPPFGTSTCSGSTRIELLQVVRAQSGKSKNVSTAFGEHEHTPERAETSGRARKRTQDSQTQLSGRFLLVMTRILPAVRDIGIAQHTTRGVDRPLLLPFVLMVVVRDYERGWLCVCVCAGAPECGQRQGAQRRGEERTERGGG